MWQVNFYWARGMVPEWKERQIPIPLGHVVAATPVLGRPVVLALQGDELGIGREPWQVEVRAENQYQAQDGSAKCLNTPHPWGSCSGRPEGQCERKCGVGFP